MTTATSVCLSVLLAWGAVAAPATGQGSAGTGSSGQSVPADAQVKADVQKSLAAKRYSDVHATVSGGVVTLTGNVDLTQPGKRQSKESTTGAVCLPSATA